jgi:amidohydrolase
MLIKPKDLLDYYEYMVSWRRELHENPEPGFEEFETSKKIEQELTKLGYNLTTGVGVTGIVATMTGAKKGKTILLRADIDALKMQEENDIPYKSKKDGLMHACGHDTHTAMLLGAAKYFSEHQDFNGTVKLVFQSAEEGPMPGGGSYVVKEGHLDDVDAVFALHITTSEEYGTFVYKPGPALAAPDEFEIIVKGVGTHASAPQSGVDPIVASSAIIQGIQTIISRQISPLNPAVITVSTIHGGSAFNIIPDQVTMTGTIRTLDEELRQDIFKKLRKISQEIASAYSCEASLHIIEAYPPLINDTKMGSFAYNIAKELVGEEKAIIAKEPSMGGEDFAYYLQKKPGAFLWLGGRPLDEKNIYYNHNPKFNVDEKSFLIGLAFHINIVKEFLNN